MEGTWLIGRVRGIAVRIHYSWLIIFGLVIWSLGAGLFPSLYPFWSPATYWLTAVICALLLFGSVLAHELGHSFVAKGQGLPVHDITLFVFGGVSNISDQPRSAGKEFWMTFVGPLTSFVLAGIFWGLLFPVPNPTSPLYAGLSYLAAINAALGVFNLIPGFPLDGGRILRSLIWKGTGNLLSATRIAGGIGQTIGYLMIFFGIWQALVGGIFNGLWIAFIGWFLTSAAHAEVDQLLLRGRLGNVRVADVMSHDRTAVDAELPLDDLVEHFFLGRNLRSVPVTRNGDLCGIITLADVRHVPRDRWPSTPVGLAMARHDQLVTVTPDTPLQRALQLLSENDLHQLPVVQDGQFEGVITRNMVIGYLTTRRELGLESPQQPAARRAA